MTLDRWISLLLATSFAIYSVLLRPASLLIMAVVYMALPMVAIWFGDELGSVKGGFRQFDSPTPGVIVRICGWLLLLLTPIVVKCFKLRMELFGPGFGNGGW